MEAVRESKGCPPLRPASLRLLVPPLRLLSAYLWRAVQQRRVEHYAELLELVGSVTEAVPELLSANQRVQLLLGLRATVVLELCRGDGLAHLQTIQSHLDQIHACGAELSSTPQPRCTEILKTSYTNFAHLVQKLLSVPLEKEHFFKEIFPANYGSAFDQRLQQLVSLFLSRLEELLPTPSYQQTASWLAEASHEEEEDFGLHLLEPSSLKTLLRHHRRIHTLSTAPSCSMEDIILSTLARSPPLRVESGLNSDGEEDMQVGSEGEESSPSPDIGAQDWSTARRSGLSHLFVCPSCSFAHSLRRKVQEHIQEKHHGRDAAKKTQPAPKCGRRTQQGCGDIKSQSDKGRREVMKSRGSKSEGIKHASEENTRRDAKCEDRRFLSSRPVNKNFSPDETKCPKCQKTFELPNQLKAHMRLHAMPHHCSLCEKGFTSKSGYYQHQRMHSRGRTFACRRCGKGFLCNSALRQHERLHESPWHLCPVCGKGLSAAALARHAQKHKGQRNFLCTTCGKAFLSSRELLLHTRSHTGETPYTCTHCSKGFSNKSHLDVHTRSHTGERPYLCPQCPKRFLTLNCLKRHALSHSGLKPFRCPLCHKDFSQQGNLKRHLATHKAHSS